MLAAAFAVSAQHCAGGIALDVAHHFDAAAVEFANPVRGQRTLVEFGQGHHVLSARADQQPINAGPNGGTVALATGLR